MRNMTVDKTQSYKVLGPCCLFVVKKKVRRGRDGIRNSDFLIPFAVQCLLITEPNYNSLLYECKVEAVMVS